MDLISHVDSLDTDFLNDVLLAHPSGIKIMLAPARPDVAEVVRPDDMREILRHLRLLYDYTVVDTASFLDDVVLTTLEVSDRLLLVVTPDIPTIKNVRLFLEVLDALGYLTKTKLIVNKVSRKDGITDKDITTHIKHTVWATIPRDDMTVAAAANQGIPLVTNNLKSPAAQGIAELANLIRRDRTEEAQKPFLGKETIAEGTRPSTLLGRLFG
jgi:pilus assembly protein CpaE